MLCSLAPLGSFLRPRSPYNATKRTSLQALSRHKPTSSGVRGYCNLAPKKESHNVDRGMLPKSKVQRIHGKTASSSTWLQRKAGDRYTRLAHEEGMVARSAYKLKQLLYENRDIKGSVIVDLGAAPGGWTSVVQKMFPRARIVAVDIKEMNYLPNTTQLVLDITSEEAPLVLAQALAGRKVDLLLSDMAPSFSGHRAIDHMRLMALAQTALDFGVNCLRPGGHLIFKVNRGGEEVPFKKQLEYYFEKVQFAKPDASFKDSSEVYLVAKGFFGPAGHQQPTPRFNIDTNVSANPTGDVSTGNHTDPSNDACS